jgi:hypothetical protein
MVKKSASQPKDHSQSYGYQDIGAENHEGAHEQLNYQYTKTQEKEEAHLGVCGPGKVLRQQKA